MSAVREQGDVELRVIDSGSRDRSPQVARAAGATLIEIAPEVFGHGRTRNLGAERSSGELICFLTQDAVPEPGWLAAYREAFSSTNAWGRPSDHTFPTRTAVPWSRASWPSSSTASRPMAVL